MSILKPKSANKSKTISVRIPMALANEMEKIKQQADEQGLALDISEIIERTLAQAVKSAKNELAEFVQGQKKNALYYTDNSV